jgi:amino acid adenylation domain-containing protein
MRTLLQHQVSERAQSLPETTALVWKDVRMTYGELEETSNRLASLLVDAGCEPGERVGLLMPKRPMAIVGMLGALKAGAIYVPLDPSDPGQRLARTLAAADCRWVLAAGRGGWALQEALSHAQLARAPLVGWLDEERASAPAPGAVFELADLAAFAPRQPAISKPSEVAHILFTSGSTGTPKGVMVTHAGIGQFLRWANSYFGISGQDRISQHAPLRFDISTFDIFGALWAGAEVHLVPPELNLLPHKLAALIRDARLTQWFSVPAVLNLLAKFDAVREHDFPELRRMLFAGEVLPTPTLIYLMQRLPHVRFTNLYGPTETTISSSFHTIETIPGERDAIPIGIACDGEELRVLDEQLQPVPDGQTGDLYIGGAGLSPGYWRDPDKTRKAFIADPTDPGGSSRIYRTGDRARREPDGLHYYCGRADTQVKSRGYRIELGEIEAALHTLPELLESAVVAVPSTGFEGTTVCCAYVPAPGAEPGLEQLRTGLAQRVPGFMLPASWQRYDRLPRNPNGKVDRPLLAEAFRLDNTRGAADARIGSRREHDSLSTTG